MKNIKDQFTIHPGVPLVPCPHCGQRPYYQVGYYTGDPVVCPVTRKQFIMKKHRVFSISCTCCNMPEVWLADIWNTAKKWNARVHTFFGRPKWAEESYTGVDISGMDRPEKEKILNRIPTSINMPVYPETFLISELPEYSYNMGPHSPTSNHGFARVPAEIGPPDMYYPAPMEARNVIVVGREYVLRIDDNTITTGIGKI